MIFVTVGTHEQPFNRLVQEIDNLKRDGVITEDVIIQTGYSTYEPKYCQWDKLIPYKQMIKNVEDARIVITHGGPASFIMPLQIGKTPIVVPRQKKFDEHVNDHQVEFARNVIGYDDAHSVEISMSKTMISNNIKFCEEFEKIVKSIKD